ncbi:MAG TPA: precorrin-2 C(20)-methyltransferase [Xanthobacteraceae bacterium]|jgi:precorrin-2/cobalt-factor-2 C20-methyltransferase|nr:precorrin-2 C(20)-methyltransferase [Xanthobacteraceae bacterium]
MTAPGKLLGVGVGPGDPELMTVKAVRALGKADVIVYFAKAGAAGNGWTIAAEHIQTSAEKLPLIYPITTEIPKDAPDYRKALCDFYDKAAANIATRLDTGRDVAVVCEGDPMFFGSYMHVHVRLAPQYPTEIIAGVTGMSGCWSAAGLPMAQGDDILTVLAGTLSEAELERRLVTTDAAVIMKLGRNLPKVRRALERSARLDRAIYVERGTMDGSRIMPLADKRDDDAPYFAVVLVPGWEHRS